MQQWGPSGLGRNLSLCTSDEYSSVEARDSCILQSNLLD